MPASNTLGWFQTNILSKHIVLLVDIQEIKYHFQSIQILFPDLLALKR